MDEVKNDYIEKALNELVAIFGVREFYGETRLISLVNYKEVKEAIKDIALQLGLPIEVSISYVSKDYRPNANDGFQSTHLVKTDRHSRGIDGITAQVSIPWNLPFYKTSGMVNFPISVRLSENCLENPETFISVMAHELSHIVLHSLRHKEKQNEFYTDLTAMIFGFGNIMKSGRKVVKSTRIDEGFLSRKYTIHTETTTYGYLSDENFNFALNKIGKDLSKQKSIEQKLLKRLRQFEKQLSKTKRLPLYFIKYLEYLGKNFNQNISQEDAYRISSFHRPDYTDSIQSILKKNEINLEKIKNYNGKSIEIIQQYTTQLTSVSEELKRHHDLFQKDINILSKYISFFHKLKLKFSYMLK